MGMDDTPDGFLFLVGLAGLAAAGLCVLPSFAGTPDLQTASFDPQAYEVDIANQTLVHELQELTELVASAHRGQGDHLYLLIDRLAEARDNEQLSEAAEAALMESAMVLAPELVLEELSYDIDLDSLGLNDRLEQQLWLLESKQELKEGTKRVSRIYDRARRHDDELSMRCAISRVNQLQQLGELSSAEHAVFRQARRDHDNEAALASIARLAVVRDFTEQRLTSAQTCRAHYAQPAWRNTADESLDVCASDFGAPSYHWYSGEYIPQKECTEDT